MTFLIENYVEQCTEAYGTKGDGSFECIGLTLKKGTIINQKCYRLAALSSCVENHSDVEKLIVEEMPYIKGYIDNKLIKVFGISNKSDIEKSVCRVSLRINNQKDKNICESVVKALIVDDIYLKNEIIELNNIIQKCINTSKYTIEQIGYGLDKKGRSFEKKVYFSLYQFKNQQDVVGKVIRKETFESLIERICDFFSIPICKKKILNECIEFTCDPIMLGINKTRLARELKFYFQYYEDEENYSTFCKFLRKIGEYGEVIEDILAIMQRRKLYIKGFALCYNLENLNLTIKPYFYMRNNKLKK